MTIDAPTVLFQIFHQAMPLSSSVFKDRVDVAHIHRILNRLFIPNVFPQNCHRPQAAFYQIRVSRYFEVIDKDLKFIAQILYSKRMPLSTTCLRLLSYINPIEFLYRFCRLDRTLFCLPPLIKSPGACGIPPASSARLPSILPLAGYTALIVPQHR